MLRQGCDIPANQSLFSFYFVLVLHLKNHIKFYAKFAFMMKYYLCPFYVSYERNVTYIMANWFSKAALRAMLNITIWLQIFYLVGFWCVFVWCVCHDDDDDDDSSAPNYRYYSFKLKHWPFGNETKRPNDHIRCYRWPA